MSEKSSYEILEVAVTAGDEEIKSAYRKLAVRFHPDKNPDNPSAADRFREITAAYESIRDVQHRQAYEISRNAQRGESTTQAAATSFHSRSGFDLADALRAFMSTMRSDTVLRESFEANRSGAHCGSNVQTTVALTLNEIALGTQKSVTVSHSQQCSKCKGKGSEKNPKLSTCHQCGGHGVVRIEGSVETIMCPVCHGTKQEILNSCAVCKGTGVVQGESVLMVKFPPGIGEGNVLTLSGKGNAGFRGCTPGDLQIYIEEIPDSQFRRAGYDLETDATITVLTAILGGRCMAMTLDGETVSIRIPEGTQPETLFSLKSYGLPVYKEDGRGNLYVRVHVKIPEKITAAERMYYESLVQLSTTSRPSTTPKVEKDDWVIRKSDTSWVLNGGNGDWDSSLLEKPEVIELLEQRQIRIGLDVTKITTVHSITIGFWIKLMRRLQANETEFFLVNPSKEVFNLLKDINLDSIFEIVNMKH